MRMSRSIRSFCSSHPLETALQARSLDCSLRSIREVWETRSACNGQHIHRFLTLCKENDDPNKALQLWHSSQELNGVLFIQASNRIIDQLAKSGLIREATKVFLALGDSADTESYNIILDGICKNEQVRSLTLEDLESMRRKAGIPHDVFSCSILVNHFTRTGQFQQAISFFEQHKGQMPLSCHTASALIREYLNQGMTEKAVRLLSDCDSQKVKLDEYVYSNLIFALCKADKGKKALQVFEAMRSTGDQPNLITYSTLINGLCKQGSRSLVLAAHKIYQDLKQTKETIGIKVYVILATALIDQGATREALTVLNDLINADYEPTTLLLNKAVEHLFKTQKFPIAMQFWERMLPISQPNVFTFNIILSYCFKNDQTQHIGPLLETMKKSRVSPDDFTKTLLRNNAWSR